MSRDCELCGGSGHDIATACNGPECALEEAECEGCCPACLGTGQAEAQDEEPRDAE